MFSVRAVLLSAVLSLMVLAFGAQRIAAAAVVDNDIRALLDDADLDPSFLDEFAPQAFEIKDEESMSEAPTSSPTSAPVTTPAPSSSSPEEVGSTSGAGRAHGSIAMATITAVAAVLTGATAMA